MKAFLFSSIILNLGLLIVVAVKQPPVVQWFPVREKIIYEQKIIPLTRVIRKDVIVEKLIFVNRCDYIPEPISLAEVELEPPVMLQKPKDQNIGFIPSHRFILMVGAGYGVIDKTLKPVDDETYIFSKKMGMVYEGQILYSPKGTKIWTGVGATSNQNYMFNLGWEFDFK